MKKKRVVKAKHRPISKSNKNHQKTRKNVKKTNAVKPLKSKTSGILSKVVLFFQNPENGLKNLANGGTIPSGKFSK